MKKYIIIKADTNDGDYITKKSKITDEQIELIKPIIKEIKKQHNEYRILDCGNTAEKFYGSLPNFDFFDNLVPHGEYGVHTIESIEVLVVQKEIKLL